MTSENGRSGAEKGGFRPTLGGYSAIVKREDDGANAREWHPKPPLGGTGQTALKNNGIRAAAPKKGA
jgi:hypothetical protein